MKNLVLTLFLSLGFTTFAQAAGNAVIDTKANCPKPEYPKASLMNEEQGTVTLSLLVNTDGSVAESKVEKSSGSKGLDKAALKALTACKFKPSGKADWQNIEYTWTLQ